MGPLDCYANPGAMTSCKHNGWLRLWKKEEVVALEKSDRPLRLLRELDDPDEPVGCVVFVGNETKSRTLVSLGVKAASSKAQQHQGEYHLHTSQFHSTPVIIGDVNTLHHNRLPRSRKHQPCHEAVDVQVVHNDPVAKAVDVADELFYRVFSTLADVVCLFVNDLGGIDRTLQRLSLWANRIRSLEHPVHPTLMLAVSREQKVATQSAVKSWAHREATLLLPLFCRVHVVSFPGKAQRWRTGPFRRQLIQAIDLGCRDRLESGLLFSARHTSFFLNAIAECAARSPYEQFDFIRVAKVHGHILPPKSLKMHLFNLAGPFKNPSLLQHVVVPLIASSFLLDHYRPDMHRKCSRSDFVGRWLTSCQSFTRAASFIRYTRKYVLN